MNKRYTMIALLASSASLLSAEMNAHIEVKLFKTWVLKGEISFGGFAIKNTGTDPLPLAKDPAYFEIAQLMQNKTGNEGQRESSYKGIERHGGGFISLLPGETHVYEGRTFYLNNPEEKIPFTMPIYFGNGVWIETESISFNEVVPDSIEHVATLTDVNGSRDLVAVTYKNERWLYTRLASRLRNKEDLFFPDFPLSLTNKIRVEPHDGKRLHKIWDGENSMIYQIGTGMLLEGPDENNVFGKWTRERKQQAEIENAEVRRKKAEETP